MPARDPRDDSRPADQEVPHLLSDQPPNAALAHANAQSTPAELMPLPAVMVALQSQIADKINVRDIFWFCSNSVRVPLHPN